MFADALKELRTKADLYQNDIAEALNVTQQTVAKWESGKAMPSVEMICTIANYFHVSTDYLLGLTDYKNIDDQLLVKKSNVDEKFNRLSPASQNQILQIFHELTDCVADYEAIRAKKYVDIDSGLGQHLINTLVTNIRAYQAAATYLKKQMPLSSTIYKLNEMLQNSDNSLRFVWSLAEEMESKNKFSSSEEPPNIIFLRHALQSVSAGTGTYLSDECMEKIRVKLSRETARADFCVTVSGNSMEPKFHDGDILLIHEQPDVEIGEYGIFEINDESYVKERGKHELISLNQEYDNIPFHPDDHIKCFGKVVGILDPASIL